MDTLPILCLDFDGVCHLQAVYTLDAAIDGEPVPGLFEALLAYQKVFEIHIFSTRSRTEAGRRAMLDWLDRKYADWCIAQNLATPEVIDVSFPSTKPPAYVGLDDRVLTFKGGWPNVSVLKEFKAWHEPTGAERLRK